MFNYGSKRDGRILEFLKAHLEKALFALAMCISLWLIIAGIRTRSGLDSDQTPMSLADKTESVERFITQFKWEDFRQEREPSRPITPEPDPIRSAAYELEQLIRPPYQRPRARRTDPLLLPPEHLQVRTGFGVVKLSPRPVEPNRDFPGAEDTPSSNTKGVFFNAITAVIPYKMQLEEYRRSLSLALGYNPDRDQPIYENWMLERRNVRNGVPVGNWNLISHRNQAMRVAKQWERRSGDDFVNDECVDHLLTMPIPKLDLADADLEFLMRHDEIPKRRSLTRNQRPQVDVSVDGADNPTPEIDDILNSPQLPRNGTRSDGQQMTPADGGSYTDDVRTSIRSVRADQLMFRYVDFDVAAGQSYVYRLRLRLIDPNDPLVGPTPRAKELDIAVQQRLLNRPDPPASLLRNRINHIFYRDTDFSLPSPIVQTTDGKRVLVDSIVVPRKSRGIQRPGRLDTAILVLADFDQGLAADTVSRVSMMRGSVANITTRAKNIPRAAQPQQGDNPPIRPDVSDTYPDPNDQRPTVEPTEEPVTHRFRSDVVVMDMMPGRQLDEAGLSTPAEVLIFENGGMRIIRSDESSDEIARFFPIKRP